MGGKNRDWGYTSYDVDSDEDNPTLTYTSYEKDGAVNRYTDNGDGGHSHSYWSNADDYNAGEDPDQIRLSSDGHKNPSEKDINDNGGCYLTTACFTHFQGGFVDDCYHLTKLRWFRDNFVSKEDIKQYYEVAPKIVEAINNESNKDEIYEYIFVNVVDACVKAIEQEDYQFAYERYKQTVLMFEQTFVSETEKC